MTSVLAFVATFLAIATMINLERVRRRLNKMEAMLFYKNVLTMKEMQDNNLPEGVKEWLKDVNKM